jgi:hypothetical protein
MPKEVIYSSQEAWPDSPEVAVLEVRWSRETEYCQVATVCLDRATHDSLTREVDGGWYISLDRRAINDTIRHLRKARDQAFGPDE